MKCAVLAGGNGVRLWPISTPEHPKQFLPLLDKNTMLYNTLKRNAGFCDEFIIMTGCEYEKLATNELEKLGSKGKIVLESVGRNTAPAIALAAMLCDRDEILFVVPADAHIDAGANYTNCIMQALSLANAGHIVTFGIAPTKPHTGYGYIKHSGFDVRHFKEKPDATTAGQYIKSGDYLWNSGMFMFSCGVLLDELKKYRYDIFTACETLFCALKSDDVITLSRELSEKIPAESIDFAVMEKSDKIKVVPSNFAWSDVGSPESLAELESFDTNNNAIIGKNIIVNECSDAVVINKSVTSVVVNGLSDVVVCVSDAGVYITKKGKSQDIKNILASRDF